jgi:hypothetical protein
VRGACHARRRCSVCALVVAWLSPRVQV